MNGFARLSAIACVAMQLALLSACDSFLSTEERLERAEQRIAAGDDRGAAIEIQNALRSEPESVPARLVLADLSLRLGDPKSAESELAVARKHGASAAETAELSARVLLAMNQGKELLLALESGQISVEEPKRSTYRGLALLGAAQWQAAIEAFDAALSADPNTHRARVGRAEALVGMGDSGRALAELAQVIEADPGNAQALLRQGLLLVRQGEFEGATRALAAARKHAPGQLSITQQLAAIAAQVESHLGGGRVEEAQSAQAELARIAPDAPATRLLAARIAMVRQDFAGVVAETQKVLKADPESVAAKLLQGAALLAQGRLNQAEVQLSEVVRRAPENVEARKLLARVNLQLQRPDMAVQVLLPTYREQDKNSQVDALLGLANLQRGDTAEAVKLLERSVAADPDNHQLKLDLAFAYYAAGAYPQAVQVLQSIPASATDSRREGLLIAAVAESKGADAARQEMARLLASQPKDVGLKNMVALFHARMGEFDRARQLLREALELDPNFKSTLFNTARIEMTAANPAAAVAALERLVAAQPKDAQAALALAQAAIAAGDEQKAAEALEALRTNAPDALEPRLLLARLYSRQRRVSDADAVIAEIQARVQGRPDIANGVGNYYADSGRFEQALSWFRQASVQDTNNASYALDVARAQLAMGNVAAARETLQQTIAAHPGSPDAAVTLVRLDVRNGNREDAQKRLAQLVHDHPESVAVATLQGDMQMATQSYAPAAASYWKAFQRAPSSALALRAHNARVLAKMPDATVPLEQWLARNPRDPAVLVALAESHVSRGQAQAAIELYERETRAGQANPMMLNNLAWLYHERGDGRAAPTAKQAYELAPQVPQVADTYGWILVNAGQPAEALPILRKAASDSNQAIIRYHYAVALARAGQQGTARQELTELTRSPDLGTAKLARQFLSELGV